MPPTENGDPMTSFFVFASRTPVLWTTLAGSLAWVFLVFPALPLGADMLDIRYGYSWQELGTAMEQYGASGRTIYAWASPTLDTVFPILYVTLFSGILYRFAPRVSWRVLAWLPVFAGAWDLCENAQITAMMLMYPDITSDQVAVASFFTRIKWLCFMPAYLLPTVVVVLVALVRRLVAMVKLRLT